MSNLRIRLWEMIGLMLWKHLLLWTNRSGLMGLVSLCKHLNIPLIGLPESLAFQAIALLVFRDCSSILFSHHCIWCLFTLVQVLKFMEFFYVPYEPKIREGTLLDVSRSDFLMVNCFFGMCCHLSHFFSLLGPSVEIHEVTSNSVLLDSTYVIVPVLGKS